MRYLPGYQNSPLGSRELRGYIDSAGEVSRVYFFMDSLRPNKIPTKQPIRHPMSIVPCRTPTASSTSPFTASLKLLPSWISHINQYTILTKDPMLIQMTKSFDTMINLRNNIIISYTPKTYNITAIIVVK
jgi:hypothetical protein